MKTSLERPTPEGQQQKFNLDISNQELLQDILITSAKYGILNEPIIRFNCLKQVRLMVAPGINKKGMVVIYFHI